MIKHLSEVQLMKKFESLMNHSGPEKDSISADLMLSIDLRTATDISGFAAAAKKNGCSLAGVPSFLPDKGGLYLRYDTFTCMVPDSCQVQVLAYGISDDDRSVLSDLCSDIFRFKKYAFEKNLVLIWADPDPSFPEIFEKMILIFENIMAVRGSAGFHRNIEVMESVKAMTPARIRALAKKYGINPEEYCRNPFRKNSAGCSGTSSELFAGKTGTRFYVQNLKERLKTAAASELVLEALRNGTFEPFGHSGSMSSILIDKLIVQTDRLLNTDDTGLAQILLREGNRIKKIYDYCLAVSVINVNRIPGVKSCLRFIKKCLTGRACSFIRHIPVPEAYRGIRDDLADINDCIKKGASPEQAEKYIESIYRRFLGMLSGEITESLAALPGTEKWNILSMDDFKNGEKNLQGKESALLSSEGFRKLIKRNALPAAVFLTLSSAYISAFRDSAARSPKNKRMLWVTDTLEDNNGIAMFLQSMLAEIRKNDLPIDIMICSSKMKSGKHLTVLPPSAGFTLPFYQQQPFRIPSILDVLKTFEQGGYDRVMASTEGPMGICAAVIKHTFSVPAYFYMHTDWKAFGKDMLKFPPQKITRWEAWLIDIYGIFDSLFVLNSDQKAWLTGERMGFTPGKIFQTAHWADSEFRPVKTDREKLFGIKASDPVILFAGRISEEKGIYDIPYIYREVRKKLPDVKLVLAGMGPDEKKLKELIPDGIFLGWVDHSKLPELYSASDILILPSRFDTFGCVVVEALSCGCPVAAYNMKGPRDILTHGKCGFLSEDRKVMAEDIAGYLLEKNIQKKIKKSALARSRKYRPEAIIKKLREDIDL